jgi:hypothetical protein
LLSGFPLGFSGFWRYLIFPCPDPCFCCGLIFSKPIYLSNWSSNWYLYGMSSIHL